MTDTGTSIAGIAKSRVPAIAAALLVLGAGGEAHAAESFRWVQYVPGGLEARSIGEGGACPVATLDGTPAGMQVRSAPGAGYPIQVCALTVPDGTRSATIDGTPLRLPVADPRRILVLADTGCRMKGSKVQACNDINQWPFRVVASVAATMKPDLVVHLGDYHYRETACPAGNLGCAGSPFGDNWAVWRADFFSPAEPLLAAAPWIAVRGNHEECNRGGKGWTRTLDPRPFDPATPCVAASAAPYTVKLPGLALAVLDVATADEETVSTVQAEAYRDQLQTVGQALAGGQSWLLLHRPIWSAEEMKGGRVVGANETLAAAAQNGGMPAAVSAMFSGHHHTFQVLNYDPAADLPPQVVAGHGGDYADEGVPDDPAGLTILGVRVAGGMNQHGYGFLLMERAGPPGSEWTAPSHDLRGNPVRSCTISVRVVTCGPRRVPGG